jgi:hypothetical protein
VLQGETLTNRDDGIEISECECEKESLRVTTEEGAA